MKEEYINRIILFSINGTYLVKIPDGSSFVSRWRWFNDSREELEYSHENWSSYGRAKITTLRQDLLEFDDPGYSSDVAGYSKVREGDLFTLVPEYSLFGQANGRVQTALSQFEHTYPEYAGKATLTGGDGNRTWQQQMEFILSRPQSYPNISRRFTRQFGLSLPAPSNQMTTEMLRWWEREIMAQAGLPDGFAHIGGKAQDIFVGKLDNYGKQLLSDIIQRNGLHIINEKPPEYDVPLFSATVFHCYIP
jgi:hypothetical protein